MERGWDIRHAERVARLYEEAFGAKFASAVPGRDDRRAVIAASLQPSWSFSARLDGNIVGIAGFHDSTGSLTSGLGLRGLLRELGLMAGIRAAAVFSLFERKPREGELVMDGIAVDASCRGRGVGTQLLDAIIEHARRDGFRSVRLDVIDTNPRARRLYESRGFVATHTEHFPWLRSVIGFSAATTMTFDLASTADDA